MYKGPFFLVLYLCNKKDQRTKFCQRPTTIAHNEIMAPPPPPLTKILDPPLITPWQKAFIWNIKLAKQKLLTETNLYARMQKFR